MNDSFEDHDCHAGPEDGCLHPSHRQDDEDAANEAYEEAMAERYLPIVKNRLLSEGWRPPEHSIEAAARKEIERLSVMAIPF
ncbi:MAG: hypothetical protein QME66_05540 [Candidatus Eisenbacteria bacterium]|nr:hypothetical protein [Candidatus Eisenbacteria bacterium]